MMALENRLISGWVKRKGPRMLLLPTRQVKRNQRKGSQGLMGISWMSAMVSSSFDFEGDAGSKMGTPVPMISGFGFSSKTLGFWPLLTFIASFTFFAFFLPVFFFVFFVSPPSY